MINITRSVLFGADMNTSIHTNSILLQDKQALLINTITKVTVLIFLAIIFKQIYFIWKLLVFGEIIYMDITYQYIINSIVVSLDSIISLVTIYLQFSFSNNIYEHTLIKCHKCCLKDVKHRAQKQIKSTKINESTKLI